jgi:hypothetical protein
MMQNPAIFKKLRSKYFMMPTMLHQLAYPFSNNQYAIHFSNTDYNPLHQYAFKAQPIQVIPQPVSVKPGVGKLSNQF